MERREGKQTLTKKWDVFEKKVRGNNSRESGKEGKKKRKGRKKCTASD